MTLYQFPGPALYYHKLKNEFGQLLMFQEFVTGLYYVMLMLFFGLMFVLELFGLIKYHK